jgi:hypothetical protein
MDDDIEPDLVDLLQRIDPMNHEQRAIVGGVLATLQAFDDDDAAGRWIDQHKQSILDELKRAQ